MKWLAVPLLFMPVAAYADEQRCDDLLGGCVCSEAMNNSDTWIEADNYRDPSDSTTDECGISTPGNTLQEFGGLKDSDCATTCMFTGSSIGLPEVGNVFQTKAEGFSHIENDQYSGQDMASRTVCYRQHSRWGDGGSANRPGPDSNPDDLKGMAIQGGSGYQPYLHWNWENCSGCGGSTGENIVVFKFPTSQSDWSFASQNRYGSGDTIQLQHAWDDWMYIEWCFDHNDSDFTPNSLNVRARWTIGAKTRNMTQLSTNQNASITAPPDHQIVKSFCNRGSSQDGACAGTHTWYSHIMQADVPVDDQFWIGPAIELSGGAPATSGVSGGGVGGGGAQ